MAERNSGDDQDRRPGDDQEDGPGENQEQDNAGDEPAQASSSWERPSSSWERPGARPGNTPARQPLTEYKKWYNRNRPGKKERQEGAKARGIPPPPGVVKGYEAKGKDSKGKEKGKEKGKDKGKQYKGEQGKGKGQPGKVGGRTPPPPPPRKRPAAALVEPGDSQNPADEQEYSYYSTEEEGPQAKARIQLFSAPARRLRGSARLHVRPLFWFLSKKYSFGCRRLIIATSLVVPVQFCRKGLNQWRAGGKDADGSPNGDPVTLTRLGHRVIGRRRVLSQGGQRNRERT